MICCRYTFRIVIGKGLFSSAEIALHQLMSLLVHQLITNFGKVKISLLLYPSPSVAILNYRVCLPQTSLINSTFSFHCKSAAIRQSSPFASQSAKADTINRSLTEQADRLDKGFGCQIYRKVSMNECNGTTVDTTLAYLRNTTI